MPNMYIKGHVVQKSMHTDRQTHAHSGSVILSGQQKWWITRPNIV